MILRSLKLFVAILSVQMSNPMWAQSEDHFGGERKKMVKDQITSRHVKDPKVINAMLKVPRHLFVPEESMNSSYQDYPLPIGYGQTISQPYIVAYMTEAARLNPEDKVLEIGTGSGYQAAVLGEIVKEVYSIEIIKELATEARARLKNLNYENIFVRWGDGFEGWKEHAPYDAIIVTAAPNEIPQKLVAQLKVGGRMVIPVGAFFQNLLLITKTPKGIKKEELLPVRFVPMVKGKEESRE